MSFKNFIVLIPAFNEERSIKSVIESLKKVGFRDVLVVNDCSTDKTYNIAQKCGVHIITHQKNLGLGASLRTGISWIIRNPKYEYLITSDADGQHLAKDVERVASKALKGGDLIYGQRKFTDKQVPRNKQIIGWLADFITYLFARKFIRDSQSGLKCFRVDKLKLLQLKIDGYAIHSEIIIEATKNNFRIVSIPIRAIYTNYSMGKQKRLRIKDSFKITKNLFFRYIFTHS